MLALLWARPRSLPQGVLVIYFGSAASWRPCNVVRPHQGPVSHSRRLYGRPSAQCNVRYIGATTRVMYWCHVSDGSVFVGWLGRGNTTSHLLHHTSHTAPSTSFVSLPPWPCSWRDALCSQVCCRGNGWQAINPRCPGCLSLRGRRASPRSGNSTGTLPQLLL